MTFHFLESPRGEKQPFVLPLWILYKFNVLTSVSSLLSPLTGTVPSGVMKTQPNAYIENNLSDSFFKPGLPL